MDKFKDEYVKNCTLIGRFKILSKILDLFWLIPIMIMYIYSVTFYNVDDPPILMVFFFLVSLLISAIVLFFVLNRRIATFYKVKLRFSDLYNQNIQDKLNNNFLDLINQYGLNNEDKLKQYIKKAEQKSALKRYDWVSDKALASSIFLPIWIGFTNSSFNNTIYDLNQVFSFLLVLGTIIFVSIFFVKKTIFAFILDYTNRESKEYEQLASKLEDYKWELLSVHKKIENKDKLKTGSQKSS